MPDFSLVPVDHQPEFEDVSLVPVDHDPFGDNSTIQQAQIQPAQAQQAQSQTQPAQPQQPQPQPQQPPTGVGQPNVGTPAVGESAPGGSQGGNGINPNGGETGGPNPASGQGGSSEPVPFGGFANPTPTESLINRAKMGDLIRTIEANPKAKIGNITGDDGDPYQFVTTKPPIAQYMIDGNTGTVFTVTDPFYARDGARTAFIEASPERPVTVTARGDGTFTISRP